MVNDFASCLSTLLHSHVGGRAAVQLNLTHWGQVGSRRLAQATASWNSTTNPVIGEQQLYLFCYILFMSCLHVGLFTLRVPKETAGEHFGGLQMLTSLLAPKGSRSAKPLVEDVTAGKSDNFMSTLSLSTQVINIARKG